LGGGASCPAIGQTVHVDAECVQLRGVRHQEAVLEAKPEVAVKSRIEPVPALGDRRAEPLPCTGAMQHRPGVFRHPLRAMIGRERDQRAFARDHRPQ
jgi:hypothetical protein